MSWTSGTMSRPTHLELRGHEKQPNKWGKCAVCAKARQAAWYAANRDKVIARAADWAARNRARRREIGNKWYAGNTDKARAWQRANPDRVKAWRQRWKAEHPEEVRAAHRRYESANAEKIKARRVLWSVANPEKRLKTQRKYRAANIEKYRNYLRQRRARKAKAGGTHTAADVATQLRSQHERCYWCDKKLTGNQYHVDHVIPISRGGSNGRENIVVACRRCNIRKGAMMPEEFAGRFL